MNTQNMKLTAEEQLMVARLRKSVLWWRSWGRWVTLIAWILITIASIVNLCRLSFIAGRLGELGESDRSFRVLRPILIGLTSFDVGIILIAAAMIVVVIQYWHGNPTRTLLLKLIDHCNQEKVSEAQPHS